MEFVSLQFVLFVLFSVVTLSVISKSSWYRSFLIFLLNCYFLYSFSNNSITSIGPVFLFVIAGYFSIFLANKISRVSGISFILISVVVVFIYLKRYTVVESMIPFLGIPYITVGLSYILFRIIHSTLFGSLS